MAGVLAFAVKEGVSKTAEAYKDNKLEKTNAQELKLDELKELGEKKETLEPNVEKAKNASLESVIEENKEKADQVSKQSQEVNETSEFRPLTEKEKKELKEKTGMTDANIEKCTVNNEGLIKLKCINEEYAGKTHPETGVAYVEKVVDINGVKIQVVVPEFPSVIDVVLPDELKMAPEAEQFRYLNNWLREEIKTNPELRAQFTETQIAMIEKGLKPKGFTWHHNEECCKMQLVKFETHEGTRHTGGNSIWSGGN